MAVLAIDIGGTKLAAGIVDTEGRILARGEVPTLAAEGLEPVLGRIVGLGRDLLARPEVADVSVHRVGVGCAGPVDLKAGIVFNPPNLPGWVRVPLIDDLQQALALPAVLENDANAAALGEFRYGAGRGARSIVYMTVSTGIGGGIILDGKVWHGLKDAAGEIGHMTVCPDGPAMRLRQPGVSGGDGLRYLHRPPGPGGGCRRPSDGTQRNSGADLCRRGAAGSGRGCRRP